MQVIDPTFRTYAYPGYDKDIYDPLSNILASIRYKFKKMIERAVEDSFNGSPRKQSIGYKTGKKC